MVSECPQEIRRDFSKTRVYYLISLVESMVMECNIDARGKAVRLFGGLASIVGGLSIASVAYFDVVELPYLWYASAGLLAGVPSVSSKAGRDGVLLGQWESGRQSNRE